MRYKDIFKKYNITLPDLKKIIRKYNLTREKSEVLKGNKNAKNNKGGHPATENKNAVTTGEYEIIFKKSDKFKECLYSCIIYEDTRNYYRNYLNNVIKYFPEQLTINEILKEKSLPRNLLINALIQEPI